MYTHYDSFIFYLKIGSFDDKAMKMVSKKEDAFTLVLLKNVVVEYIHFCGEVHIYVTYIE